MTVVGPWQCRVVGEHDWRPVPVPGCWEQTGIRFDVPGPVEYRASVTVPSSPDAARWWLRFGAVSYACEVYVNGRQAARHVGMWDAFQVEITALVEPGSSAEILVRVTKPSSLTAGPDSPAVPGPYPLRETLAGFLPYVWGHSHGGIWQPVELVETGPTAFDAVDVWGDADGRLRIRAELAGPGGAASDVVVAVLDPGGRMVAEQRGSALDRIAFDLRIPEPQPWSPHHPTRYTVRLTTTGDERTLRIGLRSLTTEGPLLRLNGQPLFPRMVLSWGWYPDRLYPDPGPERVRADLTELRRLGFNGVKLCLWFPPAYYFDIADELGMLLWLELPMWLPDPTDHFRRQLFTEAERLVRAAANHPSVILYTLGCELNAAVGADMLGPLYASVKRLVHDGLVRDNSGSGEAYGGLLDEFADFDDHHFYCEPEYFRPVLDHFAPRWREPRPWLFGEFADLDTFRDLRRLGAGSSSTTAAWWTSVDHRVNPQGARWQYDVPHQEERLRANGFWDRGAELERISGHQAVLHRKLTLEAVRSRPDTSGYVITGERDTPISTAGLWDDAGRLKFDADQFVAFNSDLVVTLGWDRRRAWVAGGDRPAPWDTWSYESGTTIRPHLLLANHGWSGGPASGAWEVAFDGAAPFAAGPIEADVPAGTVRRLGIAEFTAPPVDRPRRATLRVRVRCGVAATENRWPMWFFPPEPWTGCGPVKLVDPAGRLADLITLAPEAVIDAAGSDVVTVATMWTAELRATVRAGGRALLLVDAHTFAAPPDAERAPDLPLRIEAMPFWREAVKVIESHDAWADFPHDGWVDLQFFGIATDLALDTSALPGARPLLRRVDARTALLHDYATDLSYGAGRLIVTTLRFEGGAGDQPLGLRRNTAGSYLLSRWVRALRPT